MKYTSEPFRMHSGEGSDLKIGTFVLDRLFKIKINNLRSNWFLSGSIPWYIVLNTASTHLYLLPGLLARRRLYKSVAAARNIDTFGWWSTNQL